MLNIRSMSEAQRAIQDGATMLQTSVGDFFLKEPGAEPVAMDREIGEQLASHPAMERAGPHSRGPKSFVLAMGQTFAGSQPRPRQS